MTATTTSAAGSLWLDTAPAPGHPSLSGPVSVDVAVLGGGITGLTTALLLKRAGARVAVLEAREVGSGVTGCTTAKLSALQSTILSTVRSRHSAEATAVYAEASAAAVERVAEIVAAEGIDCELERRTAYTYAAEASEEDAVTAELDVAREAGLPVRAADPPDLPYPVHGAVALADQLQLQPVSYVRGLAAAVDGDGSVVFEHSRALSVHDGAPCRIETEAGIVTAERVVVATHYPILDRGLYFARLDPERSYCIAARVKGGVPEGMSISAGSPSRSLRSYQGMLIVGGEGHPAAGYEATPERYARLEEFARRHWNVQEVTHRWSAQDPQAYDHLPMIGPYVPRRDRLWVATGFMKWGLTSGTFAAMILAERLQGRDHPWADTFAPSRVSLRSAHEIGGLGAKFSADFVLDRAKPAQAGSIEDVPRGEARVVRSGLGKTGVFRSADDTVHAVSLRCTHLGCLLRFNGAERSWDCPCHGSRFAVDGNVLEGPAVHPLERRDPGAL